MNTSYFERKRYLKNSIKETYEREDQLDKLLARYHAQNKRAHNSLDVRRYREMYETNNLIQMENTLKQVAIDTRKFYEKLIKKLID